MKKPLIALLLASLAPLAVALPQPAFAKAAKADPAAQLKALFAQSDEDNLKRNPISALDRGDLRYADQFGDYITPAWYAAELKAARSELARLKRIPRAKLNATDKIAWDVFKWQKEDTIKGLTPAMLKLTAVRPMNHFSGFHTFWPVYSSGKSGAPFNTLADYENNLKRHKGYVLGLDRAIGRFREGLKSGVVETKLTTRNMIEQFDAQLKQPVEESPFYGPVKDFPATIREADQDRLRTAYRALVEQEINPAHKRMRDFLEKEYLPAAREGVGLMHMKGGNTVYAAAIESTTTLKMDAESIHQLGLSEVKRILTEMEKVKAEVGFSGTLPEFFNHLRTDPKLKKDSRQALTDGYYAIGKAVDAKIGDYFSVIPKTPLEIRPYEEFREKFEAGGSYQGGTADGKRPGIFFFNAYDLPSRTTPGMTTLYLHEGAPGHHFQISLAQENTALPPFMRYGGNTAYVEGWALYAETLGYEMGFYKDPYQRMGTLSDEMLRAMRLVVDTGLHAKGWTRNQAIEYMLSNSDMGRTDATAEVERYIAIPSQALAYKLGALTIQRLRKKAETALGPKFDIRAFHDQVLNTGSLPMAVLEKKIDDWIAGQKG